MTAASSGVPHDLGSRRIEEESISYLRLVRE